MDYTNRAIVGINNPNPIKFDMEINNPNPIKIDMNHKSKFKNVLKKYYQIEAEKERPEDDNTDVREWQQADYLTEQEKEEGVLLSPEELDRRILGERLANTDPPSGAPAPFFPTYKLKGEIGGRILGKRTKRRKTNKRKTNKIRKISKRRNRK
jgi:hypothetical protein